MIMRIALAGNPNCGKTTLFNALTGAHQRVGNYPGVTVEKKTGYLTLPSDDEKGENLKFEFIDLPGIYGLSAYAMDELVTREFLLTEKPDLIINVLDASNIERNLYLTTQLMELEIPMMVALNMVDTAKSEGVFIDQKQLSLYLGMPVIPTVGHKNEGIKELVDFIKKYSHAEEALASSKPSKKASLGQDIQEAIEKMLPHLSSVSSYPSYWLACRILEGDLSVKEISEGNSALSQIKKDLENHIQETLDDDVENVMAAQRYGHVHSIVQICVQRKVLLRKTLTEKIDALALHRILGPFVLLFVLWLFYFIVFRLGEKPVELMEGLFSSLHDLGNQMIPDGIWRSLVVSGMIDGVGGVLGFTPLIMMMFLVISFLEDSGYMARIAFLLDRVLRFFGMHGNSILAYVVSGGVAGGCAVPGIMATRTLRDPKERLATLLTAPFMNCGAKLPVYSLLIASFFTSHKGSMMFLITLMSWFFALIIAGTLRKTVLRGESTPFVMELPPYRLPTLKGILIHMWERTYMYIRKAGTLILGASLVMWLIMTFPMKPVEEMKGTDPLTWKTQSLEYSFAGRIGKKIESFTKPMMGFDWQTNIALIAGFAAKEVVVSTLGVAYSLGEEGSDDGEKDAYTSSLSAKLQANPNWNPLVAFSLIVFVMLYVPCISVVSVMFKETKSIKIVAFSVFYTTTVAGLVSAFVYQIGQLVIF